MALEKVPMDREEITKSPPDDTSPNSRDNPQRVLDAIILTRSDQARNFLDGLAHGSGYFNGYEGNSGCRAYFLDQAAVSLLERKAIDKPTWLTLYACSHVCDVRNQSPEENVIAAGLSTLATILNRSDRIAVGFPMNHPPHWVAYPFPRTVHIHCTLQGLSDCFNPIEPFRIAAGLSAWKPHQITIQFSAPPTKDSPTTHPQLAQSIRLQTQWLQWLTLADQNGATLLADSGGQHILNQWLSGVPTLHLPTDPPPQNAIRIPF